MSNSVKLNIFNTEYQIVSNETEQYMQDIGYELDQSLRTIMSSDSSMSITRALVLCALTYLDKAKKSESSVEHLKEQIKSFAQDRDYANKQLEELQKEISAIKKENQQLKSQLLASGMPKNFSESNNNL